MKTMENLSSSFRTNLALVIGVAAFTPLSALRADLPSRSGEDAGPKSLSAEEVKKQSVDVDRFIAESLRQRGMELIGDSPDDQFVRRVYLNIIGRIPTYDEAVGFLDSEAPTKRADLIDQLLESPGYDSHMYNFWADILRAKTKTGPNNQTNSISYLNYLKRTIATNAPYDQWVNDMMTASGGGWEPGSTGAVGYLERDKGMPLDNMANTMQVFTGTRMECAQCHDHPFNKEIEQKDFFYLAAFTHGLKGPRTMEGYGNNAGMQERNLYENAKPEVRNVVRQMRYDIFDYGVVGAGDGRIPLPMDYQYRDADPGEIVGGKTPSFLGKSVRTPDSRDADDGREKFAGWLTSPENPRFTKVIANRLWKKVMGRGLFEPVDEMDMEVAISHPTLLAHLEKTMVGLDYNMKEFMRVLYNTRTFQFRSNPEEFDLAKPYHFAGRVLSRMSAEQIWDSMLATTVPNIDERQGSHYLPFIQYRGRYVLVGKKDMYDLYEESMQLRGKELYTYVEKLIDEMSSDGGMRESEMMSSMAMMGSGDAAEGVAQDPRWASYSTSLLRASELPSPAPTNHFLRKFGQSSRDVIEGYTVESDVTQILSLINGHVEDHIIGKSDAQIYMDMEKFSTPEEKIEVAFLSTLTRRPTADEVELFKANVEANGSQGYDDLVWTLYNTNEFMFVQ